MKYFTAEESRLIMRKTPISSLVGSKENPNYDAAEAMYAMSKSYPGMAEIFAFALGRATGIRQERARRKVREDCRQVTGGKTDGL